MTLSGLVCHRQVGTFMVNLCDVPHSNSPPSSVTDADGDAKCRKWGGFGSLKVIGNVTI